MADDTKAVPTGQPGATKPAGPAAPSVPAPAATPNVSHVPVSNVQPLNAPISSAPLTAAQAVATQQPIPAGAQLPQTEPPAGMAVTEAVGIVRGPLAIYGRGFGASDTNIFLDGRPVRTIAWRDDVIKASLPDDFEVGAYELTIKGQKFGVWIG